MCILLLFLVVSPAYAQGIDTSLLTELLTTKTVTIDQIDYVNEVIEQNPDMTNDEIVDMLSEQKDGLLIRNIIRVVVGALRPSTANAPTHDGHGNISSSGTRTGH